METPQHDVNVLSPAEGHLVGLVEGPSFIYELN